jgi:UDP-N-acetylglucosamine 1-carboxyvinyltransferase
MQKFLIRGGNALRGEVTVSGSKNAALPIICAALLTDETTALTNVPEINDVYSLLAILKEFNIKYTFENHTLTLSGKHFRYTEPPKELIERMRASVLLAPLLLARNGSFDMVYPGGCVLGKRPLDTHSYVFKKMGAQVPEEEKRLSVIWKEREPVTMVLPEMSVTATENAIMMAAITPGETRIRLAAAEPHVQDLCHFMKKMGCRIDGIGTHNLNVHGVKKLHGAKHAICGDYLEAGTYALAAAMTKGDVKIHGLQMDYLDSFWQKIEEAGIPFTLEKHSAHIKPAKKILPVKLLRTAVYPSFPTDLQAPFGALLTLGNGVSRVFETLFEGRLSYLFELEKMGAHIELLNPHQALIIGPTKLRGKPVASCDIRAGATMVLAALAAKGETVISDIKYIDRGYERLDEKLRQIGAEIQKVDA